jgi:hypothetical protein
MTVRTWFTISALVLVALTVAIVFRLRQPAPQPEILARVGQARLEGRLVESCWPKSGGDIVCEDANEGRPPVRTVPSRGEIEFTAYPVEPKDGTVVIEDADGDVVLTEEWDDEIAYSLDEGTYDLTVDAIYGGDANVSYAFRLRVS